MGEVVATIRVMPESTETDLEVLKREISEVMPVGVRLSGFAEEPVAFGLKALIVTVVLGDLEGGTDPVESAIAGVKGVESLQVTEVGRAL
ncbi:Elongation factor 1-beta [Candidatus Methanoperedenaceae archaeon GB37]|nr:Elongation factor 1-beta [Candidatus Methanoperedenaceae archaeon GB37]